MNTAPRDFTYIKPSKKRLSEYEAVTCFTQPDPDVLDAPGWFVKTAEGRPMWLRESTRLQHPCWFDFRDPASLWQRPYVKMQAEQERSLELLLEEAKEAGSFSSFDPQWVSQILGTHYRVWTYFEYGVFRCFAQSQREALSDTLGNVFCFEAVDRMRHAQAVVLYLMTLEDSIVGFRDHGVKEYWLNDAMYQPARRLTEELMALEDWGELAVAVNVIVDPLFSEIGTSQLIRRQAVSCGDYVTPMLVMSAERDRRRNQMWTAEFIKMVTKPEVETYCWNRDLLHEWIARWTPRAVEAGRALMPLFAGVSGKGVDFAEAFDQAWSGYATALQAVDLQPAPREG